MQNLYNNVKSAVIVGRSNTKWFKLTVGIRQGYVQSVDLFNIYLELVIHEATGVRLDDFIRKAEKICVWSLMNFQAGAYIRPPMQNMTRNFLN